MPRATLISIVVSAVVLALSVAAEVWRRWQARRHVASQAPAPEHGESAESVGGIIDIWAVLEPDARRVLLRIGERMVMGQRQYGLLDLATDKRDMRKEASEELLDGCVYLACVTLRRDAAPPRESTLWVSATTDGVGTAETQQGVDRATVVELPPTPRNKPPRHRRTAAEELSRSTVIESDADTRARVAAAERSTADG